MNLGMTSIFWGPWVWVCMDSILLSKFLGSNPWPYNEFGYGMCISPIQKFSSFWGNDFSLGPKTHVWGENSFHFSVNGFWGVWVRKLMILAAQLLTERHPCDATIASQIWGNPRMSFWNLASSCHGTYGETLLRRSCRRGSASALIVSYQKLWHQKCLWLKLCVSQFPSRPWHFDTLTSVSRHCNIVKPW